MRHDATIRNTLTNETFHDNGLSDIEADYVEVNGEPGTIVGFVEGFVSAPVFPETKEECEEGGYETFGFTNQGDCVAFVETMNNPGNLNELGQNVPTSHEQQVRPPNPSRGPSGPRLFFVPPSPDGLENTSLEDVLLQPAAGTIGV